VDAFANRLTVVYDACVLYPAPLRDFLMWLALEDLFRAKWTNEIHDEWIRAVLRDRPELEPQLARTKELMNANVRDCVVSGYEELIPGISLPDPDDRHVLAAAIKASSHAIVTFNLKDFPESSLSQYGIEAIHPDAFVMCQMELEKNAVLRAAKRHRASLKRPPKSVDEYLSTLAGVQLVETALQLRKYCELL